MKDIITLFCALLLFIILRILKIVFKASLARRKYLNNILESDE